MAKIEEPLETGLMSWEQQGGLAGPAHVSNEKGDRVSSSKSVFRGQYR